MEDEAGQEIPAGRRHIIERPRLTRLLDETSAKVIMLVAPAGYGKTTLARQWLTDKPHAWYQATAESADLAALGVGITEIAGDLARPVGTRFRESLRAHRDVVAESACEFLAADLERWPPGAWLAVDDYHRLSDDAKDAIERLSHMPAMHLLITSRRRPRWATARKLLYGEVFELGQSALAMNSAEANEVLQEMAGETAQGFVALANGWPAVIGLASFIDPSSFLDAATLPPELYAYIAEELYDSVRGSAQQALCALSLLPVPTATLAEELVGVEAREALAEGIRVGFLTEQVAGVHYLHPLLRTFLRRKFGEISDESRQEVAGRAVRLLISENLWEGAFEIIASFQCTDAMEDLLRASLYPLLNDGRTSTLRKFVAFGQNQGVEGPILELANAELAFMDGFHSRSRRLAQSAGRALQADESLATKAFCKAGQSAYFSDDPVGAIEHFQEARRTRGDEEDERMAIWGHFIACVELEDDGAIELLQEFEASGITSPEDKVRAQNGRLHVATRLGSLWEGVRRSEDIATTVVPETRDPTVRASFWHAYAGALRVAAIYPRALEATDRALNEVETFHLEFARAHINLAKAGVYLATGRRAEALQILDEIRAVAEARGDIYVQMNECTLRCRLHLLEGDPEAAVSITDRDWPRIPSSGQYAELLACRAIAQYRAGEKPPDALARLEEAQAASGENEASHLCAWGRALVLLHENVEDAHLVIRETFSEAWRKNVFDPFVFAYRLDPTLVHQLRLDTSTERSLDLVLTRTRDPRVGVNETSPAGLTPREREVLALLAESKSNREIAKDLYVSEATVKVHVRHILKKLGARTRTQAAIQAVTTRLLEESAAASQSTGPVEAEPPK